MPPNNQRIDQEHSYPVGPQETADDVAARLEKLELAPGTRVRLNVPGDGLTFMTEYSKLLDLKKRGKLDLTVSSPEATISKAASLVGLGGTTPLSIPAHVPAAPIGDEIMPQWNNQVVGNDRLSGATVPAGAPAPSTPAGPRPAAPPPPKVIGTDPARTPAPTATAFTPASVAPPPIAAGGEAGSLTPAQHAAGAAATKQAPASPPARGWQDNSISSGGTANVLGGTGAPVAVAQPKPPSPPPQEVRAPASVPAAVAVARPVARPLTEPKEVPLLRRTPTRRRRRWGLLIVPLALLLILSCLGGIIFTNTAALETATVNIRPVSAAPFGPLAVNVPVSIGAAAAPPQLAVSGKPITSTAPITPTGGSLAHTAQPVQAQKITATIVSHKSLATTGVRQQPKDSATGTIEFTNQGIAAISVPNGLELQAIVNGKTLRFKTVYAVTVPATDFVGHTFGIRDVDVIAEAPGTDYNGARLGGAYGSPGHQASYATIRVTSGGTTVPVKTVAQKDATDLQAALKNDITARAGKELLAQVSKDPTLRPITCTMPVDLFAGASVQAAPPVGSDADTVSGAMTTTVSVYAFHPAEAQHQAALAAQDALPAVPPPLDAQVDISGVQESALPLNQASDCSSGQVVYSTDVGGAVLRYDLPSSPALENQIRAIIAGAKTPQQAQDMIMNSPLGPYIAEVHVDARLFGLEQDKLPATSNIQVLVAPLGRPK